MEMTLNTFLALLQKGVAFVPRMDAEAVGVALEAYRRGLAFVSCIVPEGTYWSATFGESR